MKARSNLLLSCILYFYKLYKSVSYVITIYKSHKFLTKSLYINIIS